MWNRKLLLKSCEVTEFILDQYTDITKYFDVYILGTGTYTQTDDTYTYGSGILLQPRGSDPAYVILSSKFKIAPSKYKFIEIEVEGLTIKGMGSNYGYANIGLTDNYANETNHIMIELKKIVVDAHQRLQILNDGTQKYYKIYSISFDPIDCDINILVDVRKNEVTGLIEYVGGKVSNANLSVNYNFVIRSYLINSSTATPDIHFKKAVLRLYK
jgi:hypothetical protein